MPSSWSMRPHGMLQPGTEGRIHVFPAHRSPQNPPHPSTGPAAPGDAAPLPPFSRWLFSIKALPEIACVHRAASSANTSPPETEKAAQSEHRPPCPFHAPVCPGASSSAQKPSASPGTPLPAAKWGRAGVLCVPVVVSWIPSFAVGPDRRLAQPRASHSPAGEGGWWLPGAGQVAPGTRHMAPLPQWPGTAVPSCSTLPRVPSYMFIMPT